jgi:protein-S-isoprenylcysteine O-methyltransferase Ste14
MRKSLGLVYGGVCYLAFQITYLYLVGFLANLYVPKGIDGDVAAAPMLAVPINLAIIALFGLQHSVMARPAFKSWWTRYIPEPFERSTYVLATSIALASIYWLWQPLPQAVWHVEHPAARGFAWTFFVLGNLIVLCSTFMIDHLDLFGLRQVHAHWRGRPHISPAFRVAWLYRAVRHPLYLGFVLVLWSTPDMSVGHLLFAGGMSLYILVGVHYKERDLTTGFGEAYTRYRETTPMILPRLPGGGCPFHRPNPATKPR